MSAAAKEKSVDLSSQEDVDHRLEELSGTEVFPPPEAFRPKRSDDLEAMRAQADEDFAGFWAEQARGLVWAPPFETALDDSNPPFYKWFADGTLNASYNCLDRHVEAGNGDRGALHSRRGGGAGGDPH